MRWLRVRCPPATLIRLDMPLCSLIFICMTSWFATAHKPSKLNARMYIPVSVLAGPCRRLFLKKVTWGLVYAPLPRMRTGES